MTQFTKTLLAVAVTAQLFGCMGGNSSNEDVSGSLTAPTTPTSPSTTPTGPSSPSTTPTGPSSPATTQITAKAIDGVLQGALVWLDLNQNSVFDDGEPNGTTDAQGQVSLTVQKGQETAPLYVKAIPGQTVDLDRGPVETEFTLVSQADGDAVRIISPLTTLLYLETAQQNGDKELAKTALAGRLGIDRDLLEQDFITLNNSQLTFIAKAIVDQLPPGIPGSVEQLKNLQLALTDTTQQATSIYGKLQEIGLSDKGTPTLKSELEYTTHKPLISIEYATHTTEAGKEIHKGVKYYWDSVKNDFERYHDEPLIATEWTLEVSKLADGSEERYSTWQHDFNKDGLRDLQGQSLSIGTDGHRVEYFDESDSCAETLLKCTEFNRNGRILDGADMREAIAANDLSAVDFVQVWDKTPTQNGYDIVMNEFAPEGGTPTAGWFNAANPGSPTFKRIEHHATTAEGRKVTFENDWNADGSINQWESLLTRMDGSSQYASGKVVFANPLDDEFEDFADYNFQSNTRTSYWYDTVTDITPLGAGLKKVVTDGKRYLLNPEENVKQADSSNPNGTLFNHDNVTEQDIADGKKAVYVWWDHFDVGGDLNIDESGQEFKILKRDDRDGDAMKGWWIGASFAEWSRSVDDLPGKVLAQLKAGKTLEQITKKEIPGLDLYNQPVLSGPLFSGLTPSYLVSDDQTLGLNGLQKLVVNGKYMAERPTMLQLDSGLTTVVALTAGEDICTWWTCWDQQFLSIKRIDPVKGIIELSNDNESDVEASNTIYLREDDANDAITEALAPVLP